MTNNITKDDACNVLSAWTALEVLSPQSFFKPENLAGGDPKCIAYFDRYPLPWENGGEQPRKNTRLFYQIIIGTIDLDQAFGALSEKYGKKNEETATVRGEAIIGLVMVNKDGYLAQDDISFSISSFAWGLKHALKGDLDKLCCWPAVEKCTTNALDDLMRQKDADGNDLPLTKDIIQKALEKLIEIFQIPKGFVKNKKFVIRTYDSIRSTTLPQKVLLNSFYLDDLSKAESLVDRECAPLNLRKYLGLESPRARHNILDETAILKMSLAPQNIPPARWPGRGRHPLVLLQQAAVNLSITELEDGGILGINGPPGTGKTTLLRDIVAAVVTQRAIEMLDLDDPANAFSPSGKSLKFQESSLRLYHLDEDLAGHEIVIASSNNKAVENISAELPSLEAIAQDADELRYFTSLSDSLIDAESWGMISAVLGNSSNRNRFSQKFWWDPDTGFSTYLAEVLGTPQEYEVTDPLTGKIIYARKPKIVEESDPPQNHEEALYRWKKAKKDFKNALKNSKAKLAELETINKHIMEIEALEISDELGRSLLEISADHLKSKPNFFMNFFKFKKALKWHIDQGRLSNLVDAQRSIDLLRKTLDPHIIDLSLFQKSHKEIHLTSPWCNQELQELRDEVFIQAIKLHKAFIDGAAGPLRHNLGALMFAMASKSSTLNDDLHSMMESLWKTLFLVIPCISTTFASASRMLKSLPNDSLGWLLIDEAGQATPQAALGAIMKTKRTVVTGDPLQIQPVVILPSKLTKRIFATFKADSERFNAPEASLQTLADQATPYFSEFHTKYGSRIVGVPLLVHRRCADPMFSISNVIAYERLMVQAKHPQTSSIQNCLGQSTWFHVEGSTQDKWCPEEGQKVLELLRQLKSHNIQPDLYIITPFSIVAQRLRILIQESKILDSWTLEDSFAWTYERIGTVHTVQGREAEAVILVLGAQAYNQKGARVWAGSTPNILNVAVTRAKEVLYVIGQKDLWKNVGVFKELCARINHDVKTEKAA